MTDTLGPYELVRLIGRGGMGEVHLAHDTRLEREVALKLLPIELTDDPDRRARFLREARAAAALNHPNITTILDIGEEGGRTYLAQEFLDGRPLSELVAERTLPLSELAGLAVPLADALAYAHERGVIHRDLKADNVVVTSRGAPKLLDFGLAKLLRDPEEPGDKQSTTLTLAGAIFGTPGAMSPEQALGKTVDARSDVFSFGSLLYEMASGKPAFLGTTVQETLDKVLHSEPEPLTRLRRDLPSDFVAIVEKALRKDPAQRYQGIAELAADLRHFQQKTDSGLVPPGANRPAARRGRRILGAGTLAALAGLLLWRADLLGGDDATASVPRLGNPRQVTSAAGSERAPSVSGPGGLLAYHARSGADGSGKFDVWVKLIDSGTPVLRTADVPGDCAGPSISPDGATIVFSSWGPSREAHGIYLMPALSGEARLLIPNEASPGPVQWSEDGQRFARLRFEGAEDAPPWSIRVSTAGGETLRDIPLQADQDRGRGGLAWSRDERLFVFSASEDIVQADTSRLWLLRVEDSTYFPLTDGRTLVRSPSFAPDGRAVHYVSNRGGTMDLWRQELTRDGRPEGEPVPLTAGLGLRNAVFSPDGSRLVYSKGGTVSNLCRAPFAADEPATWSDAQQITFEEANVEFAHLSPDGQTFVLTTDRTGNDDLWALPAGGGAMRQLTTHPSPDWFGQWSPDGEQLLFYSYRSGDRDLWLMPSEGGPARQLTAEPGSDWFGKWSPDGTRIAYVRSVASRPQLWISPLDPWDPRLVLDAHGDVDIPTSSSIWIDDHSLLVEVGGDFALVSDDGEVLRVYEGSGPTSTCAKVPGARIILYEREGQISALDLDTGQLRRVTSLTGRPGRLGPVCCADQEQAWFTWLEDRGDIWVMDVEDGGSG